VIYGPHGAGKSHLAQGVAASWQRQFPETKIVCMAASEFAQSYAAAVDNDRLEPWRSEIRSCALLILEDLGQLAGKRGAQQELLHTLDVLTEQETPVIVTSRALPTHASALVASLRSRLSAGLTVQLTLPGPLARRAILERAAAARQLTLARGVVRELSERIHAGAPALISAVLELDLRSQVSGSPLDDERARRWLGQREREVPTLRDIARQTAKYFGLTIAQLKSPERHQPLVAGRAVAMYLARQLTPKSLQQIGAYFGGRDHTTVMHSCRRIERLVRRDHGTRLAIVELKRLLLSSAPMRL
jgi:chromosomal replication initiator protein